MSLRRSNGKRQNGTAGADAWVGPQFLNVLLEGIDEGVANVSPTGEILYANSRFGELLYADGLFKDQNDDSPKRLLGTNLNQLISAESWDDLKLALIRGSQGSTEGEITVEARPGCRRTIRLCLRPLSLAGKNTIGVTATEVTELIEKTRALQDSEASLHSLSARILQLQDEERRRIARDLHDITGQELAVVVMSLNQIAKNLGRPGLDLQRAILDAVELGRKVEDEVRLLSYLLHPPLLDEFGLGSALQWYADGFKKRSGIAVEVDCPRGLPRLAAEKETALFRVVQESLTNVLRHSGSAKAWIHLSLDSGCMRLSVEDEGRGIDGKLAAITERKSPPGVGILGMRERLQQLGGSLQICPRARGTQVIARLPIEQAEGASASAENMVPEPSAGAGAVSGEIGARAAPRISRKRILIADDHEVTRRGIRTLLQDELDLEICGEAQDGMEAVIKTKELNPDLVIMDINMPRAGGFAAAHDIRKSGASAKIIFFTTHTLAELERMSRMAGFEGFVYKMNAANDLVRGVRAVLSGNKFYDSQLIQARSA